MDNNSKKEELLAHGCVTSAVGQFIYAVFIILVAFSNPFSLAISLALIFTVFVPILSTAFILASVTDGKLNRHLGNIINFVTYAAQAYFVWCLCYKGIVSRLDQIVCEPAIFFISLCPIIMHIATPLLLPFSRLLKELSDKKHGKA